MNIFLSLMVMISTLFAGHVSVAQENGDSTKAAEFDSILRIKDVSERCDRIDIFMKNAKGLDEFYHLDQAAKLSFEARRYDKAKSYAMRLLSIAKKHKGNWNYGNAIHDGNMMLGRLELLSNHVEQAKQYLIKAGMTTGSPQLNSFGSNMLLANDLLLRGEKETVLKYLELCRKFWDMGQASLDKWEADINDGRIPDFGANLTY